MDFSSLHAGTIMLIRGADSVAKLKEDKSGMAVLNRYERKSIYSQLRNKMKAKKLKRDDDLNMKLACAKCIEKRI